MRILITGSRNWTDKAVISLGLTSQVPDILETTIVHGGARGADMLADEVARVLGCQRELWKPEYDKYPGHLAPLRRNDAMLESGIDLVLAFMLGTPEHGGTLYTVNGARARRIPLILFNWPGDADFGKAGA